MCLLYSRFVMVTKESRGRESGSDGKIQCAEDHMSPGLIKYVAQHIIVSERFYFALEHLNINAAQYSNAEYERIYREEGMNLEAII